MKMETLAISQMQKVFADERPVEDYRAQAVFEGEELSFQLAWYCGEDLTLQDEFACVSVEGPFCERVKLYEVDLVPCALPCYETDEDVLRRAPGLFPDLLRPLDERGLFLFGRQWRSLWFEVDTNGLSAGEHEVCVAVRHGETELARHRFAFRVLPVRLPVTPLVFTQWMHYDCLAQHYHVKPMSGEHWEIVWQYVECAVRHGMNMLLVPLVTPPLDTLPGRERPTVQLVGVERRGTEYRFDVSRLEQFLRRARELGIKRFEMTPLFTQWGATCAPKVMGTDGGAYQQLFGWETAADGDEYTGFLRALLPEVARCVTDLGLREYCYFHVSDEPQKPEHYPYYQKAYALVRECLPGFRVIDTLGSLEFYRSGAVDIPIVASDVYGEIAAAGAEHLWVYYCCAQYKKVANHFIAYPPYRTRVIGAQMFRMRAEGFLHWGFNFWNSKYSARCVDPFGTTDAAMAFPAGDPFVVYPGEDGQPLMSLRLKLLRQALYDYAALEAAAQRVGREAVEAYLTEQGIGSFETCGSADALGKVRDFVEAVVLNYLAEK